MADVQLRAAARHIRGLAAGGAGAGPGDGELLLAWLSGEQAAFARLVKRHGPMVLAVCRRALGQEQDAEDAFQATFLLLAGKADSVRKHESLAGWLHEVANHMAADARKAAARRRRHEGQAAEPRPAPDPARAADWQEVQAALDEEVRRLPAVYREPFVLCCLENVSCAEAARRLGQKEGTVWSRLARARQRLRDRLRRRGVSLPAVLAAAAVSGNTALSAVPARLVALAVGVATGQVPASVAALVDGAAKAAFVWKVKPVAVLLLAAGLTAAGLAVVAARPGAAGAQRSAPPPKGPRADRHGDPLPAEALARLGTVRFRHGSNVRSLAFTPDGKQVVSFGEDGTRLWDAGTGREVASAAPEREGWISDGAFLTRDGRSVLSLEGRPNRFVVSVRDLAGLKRRREFALDQPFLRGRWSPDGKLLAVVGDPDPIIELWDVPSGKRLRSWKGHPGRVWGYQFASDGKALITCGEDRAIRFWEVPTGRKLREVAAYPDIVGLVVPSPDGSLLATVGMTEVRPGVASWPRDDGVRLWDVKAGKEARRLTTGSEKVLGRRPGVFDVAFSPDGRRLAATTSDGVVRLWDPARGKRLWGTPAGGGALAFSPRGDTLAVADGPAVRLVDVATRREVHPRSGHQRGVYFAAVTGDGSVVATARARGPFRLWDAATGRQRGEMDAGERAQPLGLLRDGRTFLTSGSGRVRLWDLPTGRQLQQFRTPLSPYGGRTCVSPDGKVLAGPVEGEQGTVGLVELATGKVLHRLAGHDRRPWDGAFSPDGRILVVWGLDRSAHVWDVAGGRRLRRFPLGTGAGAIRPDRRDVYAAALSPDGRLLAYGSPDWEDRHVALHDLATGGVVRVIDKLPDRVSALAFSPDGRTLAWGGKRDATLHLVELATGRERASFHGHRGQVLSLAFSADGRTLVSGSADTTALVWDLAGRLAAEGRGKPPAAELEACWADLAGEDAARAYRALRRLASADEAIPYLRKRLRPVPVVDEKRLARLIAELDSDEFAARERASAELGRLGGAAAPACRKALAGSPSAEMRRRLERILKEEGRERESPSPGRLRQLRALEALELAAGAEARRLLAELAEGMPGAWLTESARAALGRRTPRPGEKR
jgi:RNA polymerase sigma factor (sigma-70 family)